MPADQTSDATDFVQLPVVREVLVVPFPSVCVAVTSGGNIQEAAADGFSWLSDFRTMRRLRLRGAELQRRVEGLRQSDNTLGTDAFTTSEKCFHGFRGFHVMNCRLYNDPHEQVQVLH